MLSNAVSSQRPNQLSGRDIRLDVFLFEQTAASIPHLFRALPDLKHITASARPSWPGFSLRGWIFEAHTAKMIDGAGTSQSCQIDPKLAMLVARLSRSAVCSRIQMAASEAGSVEPHAGKDRTAGGHARARNLKSGTVAF
jgi:hypothetical protein